MIRYIKNWFFGLVDSYMHSQYGDRKTELFEGHPDVLIEIGAGYGANFRYFRKGTKVKVIEPNTDFYEVLRHQAEKYEIQVEIYEAVAEDIPLSAVSYDMVICSLVLCSVNNPPKVLSEIRRILKKGGKFVFIEHVRAHRQSWICKVQNIVKSQWKWLFEGCNVTCDTGRIIQQADFSKIELKEFAHSTLFIPIIPHIAGVAVK